MSDEAGEAAAKRRATERQQRLKHALRENLGRRKAQARGRATDSRPSDRNDPAEDD